MTNQLTTKLFLSQTLLIKNMNIKTKPETATTGSWKEIPKTRIKIALLSQREKCEKRA